MNGRLVIRVGGGYMVIDEFIATYAEVELQKMRAREEKGLDPIPISDDLSSPSGKSFGSPKGSSNLNKTTKSSTSASKSPGGNSTIKFTTSDASMNGTLRTKQFTQDSIDRLRSSGGARVIGSPK